MSQQPGQYPQQYPQPGYPQQGYAPQQPQYAPQTPQNYRPQQGYGQQAPPQQVQQTLSGKSAAEILNGGKSGHPGLKMGKLHQPPNVKVGGPVLEDAGVFQVTKKDQRTGLRVPLFFPSGDPIEGITVTVQTNEREQRQPHEPPDNGVRTMFIDGRWPDDYNTKRKAVTLACQRVGAAVPERGGTLWMWWTHEVNTGAPTPAQNWEAEYIPPPSAAAGVLAPPVSQPAVQYAQQQPEYATPQQYAQPQPQYQQAPPQQYPQAAPVQAPQYAQQTPQMPQPAAYAPPVTGQYGAPLPQIQATVSLDPAQQYQPQQAPQAPAPQPAPQNMAAPAPQPQQAPVDNSPGMPPF